MDKLNKYYMEKHNKPCDHNKNSNTCVCQKIGMLLYELKLVENKDAFIINKCVLFFIKNKCIGGSESRPYNLYNIICNLMTIYIPSEEVLIKLAYNTLYHDIILYLRDNVNMGIFGNDIMITICEKFINRFYDNYELIEFMLNRCYITNDIIDILCKTKSVACLIQLEGIIRDHYKELTKKHVDDLCYFLPESANLISSIIENTNLNIDNDSLDIACEICNMEAILYILRYKIKPTKKNMQQIINSNLYSSNVAELLFNAGYLPDYEDVKYSVLKKKELPRIDRFNITYDKTIEYICYSNEFFPDYPFIDHNMIKLYKICRKGDIILYKKYIKEYNITPNEICLMGALSGVHNRKIILYLLKNNINVDYECILMCINSRYGLDILLTLLDIYNKSINNKIEHLNNQIKTQINKNTQILPIKKSNESPNIIKNINIITTNSIYPIIDFNKKHKCPKKYAEYIGNTMDTSYIEIRNTITNDIYREKWFCNKSKKINLPIKIKNIIKDNREYIMFHELDELVSNFYIS